MASRRIRDRNGWRHSLWLALGLAVAGWFAFLMPAVAAGGTDWLTGPVIAVGVAPVALFVVPLFLLVWASRPWPVPARLAAAGLAATLAAWCHAMLHAALLLMLSDVSGTPDLAPVSLARLVETFLTYGWVYGLYAAGVGLILSAIGAEERERQLGAARLAASRAELAALRLQASPHFLFNTLNAISALIVSGRAAKADELVGRLSDYVRATLAAAPDAAVELGEELRMLGDYLEIEGVRFGDRLRFAVDCPPELEDAMVPGLMLQPLVENAVRHAVNTSTRGATIRLDVALAEGRLRVAVCDDGEGQAPSLPTAPGRGLENLRNRLDILYGSGAALEAGPTGAGYAAVIALPLVRARDGRPAERVQVLKAGVGR